MNNKLVVVVTGATRGIGSAVATRYLEQGYTVFGVYKSSAVIAEQMVKKFKNLIMIQADLGDELQVQKLIETIKNKTTVVDIIVNNAGIYIGGGIKTLDIIDLQYSISVNVLSKFILTQALLPLLEKSSAPKVINVSSRFGFVGNADPESLAYNLTNSAITMMSIAMQKEFQPNNIRVGCYIPTVTNTDRFKKAFSKEEQQDVKKRGMLATKENTAKKIVRFADSLSGNGVGIDNRVSTEHLQCLNIQTV